MKAFLRLYAFLPIWIIIAVGGLLAAADFSRAQDKDKIFNASVIKKWNSYEDFSHNLQGTSRRKVVRNGKQEESVRHYKQNQVCALLDIHANRDSLLSMCSIVNPHYSAVISLNKSYPEKTILKKYSNTEEELAPVKPSDVLFSEISHHFVYNTTMRLRKVVSDPSFIVTKVAEESENGRELFRIDHTYNYSFRLGNQDSRLVRQHGSLWLDPSRCWCIHRFKSSYETIIRGEKSFDTERDIVCEVIDHPSGFPILKSMTERMKSFDYKNKKKIEVSTEANYDLEVNDSVPESEFTLSAFGLPEPGGAEPVKKPVPMYVWILIAACSCGTLAFAFRYLARRRRFAATD